MELFFRDPNEIPLPPDEMRIETLTAEPWPGGQRVRVACVVTPFLKRPSLDLTIKDDGGRVLAATSIIETMIRKLELTMHLRGPQPAGELHLEAVLYYSETPPPPSGDEPPSEPPQIAVQIIERSVVSFRIENA